MTPVPEHTPQCDTADCIHFKMPDGKCRFFDRRSIKVELTDENEFHCIKIVFSNPAYSGPLEIFLHTTQAVDLSHKLSLAICEYFRRSSALLIEQKLKQLASAEHE